MAILHDKSCKMLGKAALTSEALYRNIQGDSLLVWKRKHTMCLIRKK